MYMFKEHCSHIILIILINILLYHSIISKLRSMKEISDNGDFFVILDSGLYIYNFENPKRNVITTFNQSIFNVRDDYNRIVITKNEDKISNETKIAALINQHLYIYTFGNSNTNLEYLLIKNFAGNLYSTFPFEIEIKGYNLYIYFSVFSVPFGTGCGELYIKEFIFQNYTSIQINEPKEISSELINAINPVCQIDKKDSLIKCVCECQKCHLQFLILKKLEDNFEKLFDKRIFNYDLSEDLIPTYINGNRISKITWLISTKTINTTLVCSVELDYVYCFYNNNTDKIHFRELSLKSNMRRCLELNTYFFEENNQFVINCKKSNNSHYLILDGYNFNFIQEINITNDNYNENFTLIYNHRKNNYDIINDYFFEEISEEYKSTVEVTEINTNIVSENATIPTKFCQNIEEITKNKIENELIIPCDDYMIKLTTTYFQKKYYYNNIFFENK